MSTTYNSKFQRKFMRDGIEQIGALLILAGYIFALWQMLQAQDDGDWARATFWLVALLGMSLETKVRSIMTTVDEIKWRRP